MKIMMQGIEIYREKKKKVRDAVKKYLASVITDLNKLDSLECYIFDDMAALMKPSEVESQGLTNDIATLPITVIWFNMSDNQIEITDAGKEYFGLEEEAK